MSSGLQAQSLQPLGSVVLWPVGPSCTEGQTRVHCIDRETFNHWTQGSPNTDLDLISHVAFFVCKFCAHF